MPLRCPRDRAELAAESKHGCRVDRCPRCHGVAVTVALLRRIVPQDRLRAFWLNLPAGTPGHPCPSCAKRMLVVPFDVRGRALELDACTGCQTMWFDRDELAQFSPERQLPARDGADVSAAAAEAIALAQLGAAPPDRGTSVAGDFAIDVVLEVVTEVVFGLFI